MTYDWNDEKARARLYLWISVIVAAASTLAIVLGAKVGCGSAEGPQEIVGPPPPPVQPDCDGLEFGQTREEACPTPNGNTYASNRVLLCTVEGLRVITPCPGEPPPPPPPPPPPCTSYKELQPILQRDCAGACHNYGATYLGARNDAEKIIERVLRPSGSTGSMPLNSQMNSQQRGEYVKPFNAWKAGGFKQECTSNTDTGTGQDPKFVTWDDLEAEAAVDARKVGLADKKTTRYLYAPNVRDTGLYRKALEKGINSVSLQRAVARAVPVIAGLWRINLRDYGLNARDWEKIEAVEVLNIESRTAAGEALKATLGARKPLMHVASFLDAILANSDLYYVLTRTPETDLELYAKLGVSFAEDLEDGQASLLGVSYSRLAPHNRLISRHEASNGFFSLWRTYDTGNLDDPGKNLEENPFLAETGSSRAFLFEASEVIYIGPNGLQFYALFDATGRRQNVAPTEVVQDYHRASVGQEPVIENAISCFACHNIGLIPRVDEYGDYVKTNPDFDATDRIIGQLLYGDAVENEFLFADDNEPYVEALETLEIDPQEADPITTVEDDFVSSYNAAKAAEKLTLTEDAFLDCFASSETAQRQCGALGRGGLVTQAQFIVCVPALIEDCQLFTDPVR